jgi:hypothetical protein
MRMRAAGWMQRCRLTRALCASDRTLRRPRAPREREEGLSVVNDTDLVPCLGGRCTWLSGQQIEGQDPDS